MDRTITVQLEFKVKDLNSILTDGYYGSGEPPTVEGMTKAEFEFLKKSLQESATDFVAQIVTESYESCADGWLEEVFQPYYERDNEEKVDDDE